MAMKSAEAKRLDQINHYNLKNCIIPAIQGHV